MHTTYSAALADVLPQLVLVGEAQDKTKTNQSLRTQLRNALAFKVVTNASFLMSSSTKETAVGTLANCLADATGLLVDFSHLACR